MPRLRELGLGLFGGKAGHIVTNYHVIAKLATDQSGLQRRKVTSMEFCVIFEEWGIEDGTREDQVQESAKLCSRQEQLAFDRLRRAQYARAFKKQHGRKILRNFRPVRLAGERFPCTLRPARSEAEILTFCCMWCLLSTALKKPEEEFTRSGRPTLEAIERLIEAFDQRSTWVGSGSADGINRGCSVLFMLKFIFWTS